MMSTARQKSKFRSFLRRIRSALGSSLPVDLETIAVGLLERLWHCASSDAIRGDIGRLSDDEIAEAIGWFGSAKEIVAILVETRWLDVSEQYRLVVHDWHDHAPTYVRGNAAKVGGIVTAPPVSKTAIEAQPIGEALKDEPTRPSVPNLTKPNTTNPNQFKPNTTTPTQSVPAPVVVVSSSCSLNFSWNREDVEREIERFRKEAKVGPNKVPLPMLFKLVGFGLCTANGFTSEIAVSFREGQVRVPSRYIDGAIAQYCKKRGLVADEVVASVFRRLDELSGKEVPNA